ncbi:MAG: helix-turn-helix domain-containing protein, partial [Candidatus Absconditabacteria bacterium]|nr:helix-turn-helix domain-containing protein [Candidatus Absconditabacteria bacterium]
MNPIAEEILQHYGTPKRSGRYPWGSGDNPYQHSGDFLSRVHELKKSGMSEKEVAESMGLTTSQLRTQVGLAKDERRSLEVATAKGLREKGYSLNEIAEKMGYKNDSSVRSLLNENSEARTNQARKTAEFLKKQVDEKGMIDVGVGVERELGISKEKMKQALYILEMEGYEVYGGGVPQVTNPGKQTNIQVLCPPGTEHREIYDFGNVHSLREYVSHDGGDTFDTFVYPKSMDSNRIKIRYAEEGGIDKDGVVEIRRGVDDLSLGDSHYAQVRILVDNNKYIKGMAVYSDDMPDGVDIVFNTNKKQGTPKGDVLKNITNDPDNPFGSLIKAGGQSYYIDKDGKRQLSLINKRAEEGDWNEWSNNLPSQFLSKQSITLIKKQLNLASADKQAEFDEIMSLTNPTVKKALLKSFSDDCDSAAIHLQAAALPRQKYQVILPITSMKDNEVYAPNFEPGEQAALIRFPHGGTFEIPILTVNNKQAEARRILGNTPADAIGINSKVAERLSGADFDGDTVMVIPVGGKVKITSTPPLKGLEGFDPKLEYGGKKEGTFKVMKNTQTEMGKVSNLITDMNLKGATQDELARAVRHSMVVIDAEKHKLDYKQSELDNGIASL